MDRRGFLKMLGKGAAAAAAPKGAIAKALTNLEPTKIDAGKAIIEFFKARNAYEGSAELVNKYQFATNAISNFLLVLKQHNIDPGAGITNLQNDLQRNIGINNVIIGFLNGTISQDEGKQLLKKYNMSNMFDYEEHILMDTLEDDLVGYADYFDTLSDEVDEAVGEMFKKDLISPEAQKILEQDYEKYKCDYVKDPASKARKDKFEKERKESLERDLERYQYNRTAQDIDYARMDKAGGAEDEGYAKYYEKVNTFDKLLSVLTEEDDDMSDIFDAMADMYSDTSPIYRLVLFMTHDKQGWAQRFFKAKIINLMEFFQEINNMTAEGRGRGAALAKGVGHGESIDLATAIQHLNRGERIHTDSEDELIIYCRDKNVLQQYLHDRKENDCKPSRLRQPHIKDPEAYKRRREKEYLMSLENLNALP